MLLAVDTGNTHTVLGLFEGPDLRADWRIPTRKDTTVDELGVLFRALFRDAGLDTSRLEGMIVSSVVPGLNDVLVRTGRAVFGVEPWSVQSLRWRSPGCICPMWRHSCWLSPRWRQWLPSVPACASLP